MQIQIHISDPDPNLMTKSNADFQDSDSKYLYILNAAIVKEVFSIYRATLWPTWTERIAHLVLRIRSCITIPDPAPDPTQNRKNTNFLFITFFLLITQNVVVMLFYEPIIL